MLSNAAVAANLNQYKVLALRAGYALGPFLGEGSFKFCFEATDAQGVRFAFKILKPGIAQFDRTQRELAAMLACNHPNIARCLDSGAGTFSGTRVEYVLEELFTGGSLHDCLQKSVLSRKEVLSVGTQLIDAIGHLHARALVHRDIKPPNIMFAGDGRPVLTDFGIVRALAEQSLTMTGAPFSIGTPAYMPPEQFHNTKPLIGWRSDQFSLGVTLAIAVLGIHPFGTTFPEQYNAIAQRQNPTGAFIAAANAASLPVLIKMLQPYPIQRYIDPASLAFAWQGQ